jgi:hypothetical protein
MSGFDARFFRLERPLESQDDLKTRVADLQHLLTSAIQDLVVLQELLKEQGLWDEERYRELRRARMLAVYGGGGPAPWANDARFFHALEEEEFLRYRLNADDAQIAAFRADAKAHAEMT